MERCQTFDENSGNEVVSKEKKIGAFLWWNF